MLYKKQNNKNAWTGPQPCGFIFISFTHLFSLTHWNDCSRLQVCLQLWEFPRCNYRLFPDIFTVVPPPTLPPHLQIWSWRPGYTAALQNPSSRAATDHNIHNILLASALINCPPSCLPPYIHPPSYPPRPLIYHQRPHFKRGCSLTGSCIAAPQAFVWEVLVHCGFTSLPAGPSGFRVSRYWLLSRTDILVCECACGR